MHEQLDEFKLINMNARLYDPILGRFVQPDKYVQAPDNIQNFNRYSYVMNNPLNYTDPSGNFAVIDDWVIGFVKGAVKGLINGENWLNSGYNRANNQAENSAKIWGGLFASDASNSGGGRRLWEVASRFTYQLPQTVIGLAYNLSVNTIGNVDDVQYFHGATVVYGSAVQGGGVTIGSYISLPGRGDGYEIGIGYESRTLLHEYGHYLQSQNFGNMYLFKVGAPSLFGDATWTELDANYRSATYFERTTNGQFNWNRDIKEYMMKNYPNKYKVNKIYIDLPSTKTDPKLYEFLMFQGPFGFLSKYLTR